MNMPPLSFILSLAFVACSAAAPEAQAVADVATSERAPETQLAQKGKSDYDHSALDAILKKVVRGKKVDYKAVKAQRPALQAYIKGVSEANLKGLSKRARYAFYVNAYNANVLEMVLANGQPKSVLDVAGFFDKKKVKVAGQSLTLNQVEEKVRPPKGSPAVHFVFNCASVSCPPLANFAYTEANWLKSLWNQTGKFLKQKGEIVVDKEAKTVTVIKLFEWYKKDFGGDKGVRDFLSKYGAKEALDPSYKIVTREYNWNNNGL